MPERGGKIKDDQIPGAEREGQKRGRGGGGGGEVGEIPSAGGEVEERRELGGKPIKRTRFDTRNTDCGQQDGNLDSRKISTRRWSVVEGK